MKRFIYLFLTVLAMVLLPSCDNAGVADSPPPIYFKFEVYNSLGDDLVSSGKIRELYPNLRIIYNGEAIPLEYLGSKEIYETKGGLRFVESRFDENTIFLIFGIFFEEENQSFVVDWGDGTTNKVNFTCDWDDVGCTRLFVDGKPVPVRYSSEIEYRFVKG